MRKTKRMLSLFLSIVMVLSVVSVGFSASALELDPIVLTKMERPTVSFATSGMTRVSAGNGSFALGNVIVKATPSGVPETSGAKASDAYCGETPAATKIYFSSDYDVTDVSVSCTSGSTNLVLSDPYTEDGKTVWEIVSGNADAGDVLEFTATYNYAGKTYSSRCYSYVENIDNSCAAVFTVKAHNIMGTVYYAAICAATRILGKGVKHSLSNFDGEYGYFDAGSGSYISSKTTGYTGTYNSKMDSTSYSPIGGDSSYSDFAMNGLKSYTTVYVDTSVASTLAYNNLRMSTYNIGISYSYTKDNFQMFGTLIYNDERDTNMGYLNQIDNAAFQKIGYDSNGLDVSIKCPRGYTINTALFKGSVANLNDNDMFTIMNYFRCEYPSASMNVDVVNKTLTPLYLKTILVDKSALRASIQTVLNSEPTSPLVSNIYKGANPQNWYYKSGFGNFKSAFSNACAILNNETATQSEIDMAQQSLDSMYSNLVLNTADYSQVNDLLEQADEILANSNLYTADSIAFLQEAYDSVTYNYNLFYQSAVDTMAGNIQKALNNLEFVGADYSVVETAIANADTVTTTSYINSNASASYSVDGQTYAYYTDDFKASVANAAQAVADAVDGVVYGLDVTHQDDVNAYAASIDSAFANFSALGADYTAVNAIKSYAMGLKAANYSNFAVVRTAVNKVRNNYPVTRQSEVDVMAQDIVTAIESLALKAATKTALETALALTPEYPQAKYTEESYAAWSALVAEGQAMMADETLTILDNQAIADKAAAITEAFNALVVIESVDKTPLETALELTPEYAEANYTSESYAAWTALVAEGQAMMADDTLTAADNQVIADKAAAITEAFNALTLKAADKTALETALALTPEQGEDDYTAESYAAWIALVADGQAMYEQSLTILENQVIADKAAAITEAFNALTLKAADKTALETALALTPEQGEDDYTAESYAAWTALVAEGQAMMADETLTILDNGAIADKAAAITEAFNALTLKAADKTALETALALTPEQGEDDYTAESYAAWTALVAEGQAMMADETLTILDNGAIADKAAAITEAFNALTLKAVDTGYTFEAAEGSAAVIDTANGFIYGLEEGVTSLDGYVDYEGCEIVCTETANGFGTGTKIEVVYNGEVVETFYVVIFGDVTGDGYVDAFDVSVLSSVANFETEFEDGSAYAFAGDLNGDEFVDSFDCSILVSAANYETEIPQTK